MASAPGRVELLGNHTDYNGGLVIAAAIDRRTVFVGRAHSGREARVASVQFKDLDAFPLDDIEPTEPGAWTRYVRGVCWAISRWRGPLSAGFDAVVVGRCSARGRPFELGEPSGGVCNVPDRARCCAGAVERGASKRSGGDALRLELAQVLRRSENEFVGVGSGLLDQFSSLFGRDGCALFLDCRTLEFDRLPLGDPGPAIVVCDSKTSRTAGGWNVRPQAHRVRGCGCRVSGRVSRWSSKSQLSRLSLGQLESRWDRARPDRTQASPPRAE